MNITEYQKAYIAGFLDGDGSIHVRLKPNEDYKYKFQIAPSVVFYQGMKEIDFLKWLNSLIGSGYVRKRNDGICELTIGDVAGIEKLLSSILPYLKLKEKQARLMLKVLEMKKGIQSSVDFLMLANEIDIFEKLNYSKRRFQNSKKVENVLKEKGLLTP